MSSKTEEELPSFDEMTILYQNLLKLIAILPFEGRNLTFLGSRILLVYYITSGFIHWSMFLFYAINGEKIPSIDTICETVLAIGVELRYILLVQHRLEFASLLKESRALWEVCDADGRRAVRQFEQKIWLLVQFLFGSTVLSNIMYSTSAVILTLSAIRHNDTQPHFLPFKWYTEKGPDLWPGYKITFALQVLVIHNACVIISTVDAAGPFLIMMGAGYFRALEHRILRIYDNKDESASADMELLACARLHQRILTFCSRIDKTTRTLFFVQLLCTGYNISLAGIKLAGTDPDKYKFIPVALFQLGQLFICQWAPDHLMDESEAISSAIYNRSLIWMPRRLGKLLLLIMTRSQRPVQMTAAGIVNLSLENFGSVSAYDFKRHKSSEVLIMLTSALSFFTVLRNFNI